MSPNVGSVVFSENLGSVDGRWVWMISQIPVNQSVCLLSVHQDVLSHRYRFVLQWLPIGCEPPTSAQVPAGAFGLTPDYVVDELETDLIQNWV